MVFPSKRYTFTATNSLTYCACNGLQMDVTRDNSIKAVDHSNERLIQVVSTTTYCMQQRPVRYALNARLYNVASYCWPSLVRCLHPPQKAPSTQNEKLSVIN